MAREMITTRGTVRGNTIVLDDTPGLPDGQMVTVVLRPALPPGEGLRRAFGAWADDEDSMAAHFEGIYKDREDQRPESTP